MDLWSMSNQMKKQAVSPTEVLKTVLDRIDSVDPSLNSFITVCYEDAQRDAKRMEQEILKGGWRGPLHGIPIGIKDLIYTKGIRTTMGSKVYANFVPQYDATVVERIRRAGGVIIGKLNTHEFAYGPTGDRSYFGPVKNPHDYTKMSGGSSSGAGAAVASELCYGAIGTDTGGSIRIPSAACGVVGMKPTFGRVSKHGVFPLSFSLDHIGPMTRTVRDNATLLTFLAGYDHKDSSTVRRAREDFSRNLEKSLRGKRIGLPTSYYFEGLSSEVSGHIQGAIEIFRTLGAEIHPVDLPDPMQYWLAQQTIQKSEVYAIHEITIAEHGNDIDPEVRDRIIASANVKGHEYVKAQQLRDQMKIDFARVFTETDVLLTPTIPILPPAIGQREVEVDGTTANVRSELLRLTAPTNFTGNPSLSIPCAISKSGLPVGMQLIGRWFGEAELYQVAYHFEQARGELFAQHPSN